MSRKLNVFLHQDYVGELAQDDSGRMYFTYAGSWLGNSRAVPLSHSLPLRSETFDSKECRGFFSGILPGENKRKIIAPILGISSQNDFAMLEKIGGECAGAITFLPEGEIPSEVDHQYRPITDSELANIFRELPRRPLLAGEKGVRLSLAGAQDKLAVMIKDEKFFLPLGSSPSSHILKPAIEQFEGIVNNEAFCLELAGKLDIPSAKASVQKVADIYYLQIERYDRTAHAAENIRRVHQEDFCQALGIISDMKYQNEGGPSLKQCFDLVRAVSDMPALDLKYLLEAVIFNYCVGNNDAHGKNFSLLYFDKEIRLAPFYDIVCTSYYPELSKKMAMKIGSKYESDEVRPRHFEQLAIDIGFAAPMVRNRVPRLAQEIIEAIKKTETISDIAKSIYDRCVGIKKLFK